MFNWRELLDDGLKGMHVCLPAVEQKIPKKPNRADVKGFAHLQ